MKCNYVLLMRSLTGNTQLLTFSFSYFQSVIKTLLYNRHRQEATWPPKVNKQKTRMPSEHPWSPSNIMQSIFSYLFRSSHRRCSVRKGVLRKFAKFTGKHLCKIQRKALNPATLLKKRLWHRCFPVNFAKFYRTLPDDCFCLFSNVGIAIKHLDFL